MLIRDPINGKTEIYRLSCLVRIFKCFKWDAFRIVLYMKNKNNFYGSAHIFHNHRGGRGSLKCLRMIMGEGEGSWPYDDINNFFSQNEIVLKQKTNN